MRSQLLGLKGVMEKASRHTRIFAIIAYGLSLWLWSPSTSGQTASANVEDDDQDPVAFISGITKAHRKAVLAAVQTARIVQLKVEEGDSVEAGQVLAVLDDGVQQILAAMAKTKSESTAELDIAQVSLEQAERDLERIRRLSGGDYATDKELQDAATEALLARLEYKKAQSEHATDISEFMHQELLLERMRIRAPFSGYLTHVAKEIGETIEAGESLLTIVQLDPLLVSLDCPLEWAGKVTENQQISIRPVDTRWEARHGEVIFASRVADPASQTFRVMLEVNNHQGAWMGGLRVLVDVGHASDLEADQPKIAGRLEANLSNQQQLTQAKDP